jgi:CheY-like chemotaxis protein
VLDFAISVTQNEIRHRAILVKDIDSLPAVIASESRLGQVFVNLLLNAVQAIPEGQVEAHQIRVVGRRQDAHVVIEVHDTGQGIPDDVLPRIFEPFFTTRTAGPGTGLGLSICDSIVRALGGTIEVETQVDKGSLFRVILQATGSSPSPTRPAPERTAPRGKILVVDDEPLVALSFRRMLSRHYLVDTEQDGRRVVERLLQGERFDAILCDMMMPEMTGSQLYAEIQRIAPEQAESVVFITGGAFTESTSRFLDEVENPVLEKPISLADIRPILDELVARDRKPPA